MAFVGINGMRSHRYPLMGCGCQPTALGRVTSAIRSSLGLDLTSVALGGGVVAAGLGGLALGGLAGWYACKALGKPHANRRHRR